MKGHLKTGVAKQDAKKDKHISNAVWVCLGELCLLSGKISPIVGSVITQAIQARKYNMTWKKVMKQQADTDDGAKRCKYRYHIEKLEHSFSSDIPIST